jgi:hypothetical protein
MYLLKRVTLVGLVFAFALGLYVSAVNAQPGRARWSGNNGNHYGWTQGRHRGWDNGRSRRWRNDDSYWRYRRYRYRNYDDDYRPRYRRSYGSGLGILGSIFGVSNGNYYNNGAYYNNGYRSRKAERKAWKRYYKNQRKAYRNSGYRYY